MSEPRPKGDLSEPAENVPLEQALLGGILIDNNAVDELDIEAKDFSDAIHHRFFAAARALRAKGQSITPVTIKDAFPDIEVVKGLTLSQYFARLAAEAISTRDLPTYALLLKEIAADRSCRKATLDLAEAKAHGKSTSEALAAFRARIDEIFASLNSGGRDVATLAESTGRVVDGFDQIIQGKAVRKSIPTGLHDLDRVTGGVKRGDLVILAGRPGSGKTTLAASMGRQIAAQMEDDKHRFGVGMFSLEMPEEHIAARMLADHAYNWKAPITYNLILQAEIENEQGMELIEAQRSLDKTPFLLDCSSRLTVPEIAGRVRAMRSRLRSFGVNLDVVIVDYLKFVKASERYSGQRVLEVGEITSALKGVAKDENVCMILLAQLNREVEKRENKRPQLSDLRASGEIEEDADMVLMTYCEAYYLRNHPKIADGDAEGLVLQDRLEKCKHDMEVLTTKNRMGPTGQSKLWCDMGCGAVRSAARQEEAKQLELSSESLDPGWKPR